MIHYNYKGYGTFCARISLLLFPEDTMLFVRIYRKAVRVSSYPIITTREVGGVEGVVGEPLGSGRRLC